MQLEEVGFEDGQAFQVQNLKINFDNLVAITVNADLRVEMESPEEVAETLAALSETISDC